MHTPGPWIIIPPDRCIYHPDGKRVVAVAQHDCPEVQANVRLIAAAPKLLEALEALLEDINHIRIPGIADSNNIERSGGWARIVIAEAKS